MLDIKKFLIAAICCASFSASALNALEAFKYRLADQKTVIDRKICDLHVNSETNTAEGYATCVVKAGRSLKDNYAGAVKSFKKPNEKLAFKNYYIAVLTQVEAFKVQSGESERDYDQRQAAAESRTNEAWTRFEVEMEF